MDTTVYSKTNAGRLLAFEQKPGIAMAMRDLLKRVDGKTPYRQLVNLPGEAELFAELCRRELVKVAPQAWRNSSTTPEFSDAASSDTPPICQDSQLGVPAASKMQAIKLLMSDFIETRLPKHVSTTLPEINALASEAQLLCMLSAYINLIDPVGKAGQEHVQDLLLILAGEEQGLTA